MINIKKTILMYAHLAEQNLQILHADVPSGYFNLHVCGCVFTEHAECCPTTYTVLLFNYHQLNFCINSINTGFHYLNKVSLDGFPCDK
jgi:hypothetical protein